MNKMAPLSYVIFLQSDVRVILKNSEVIEWLDKGHLLSCAADREGCTMMWHKICMPTTEKVSYSYT